MNSQFLLICCIKISFQVMWLGYPGTSGAPFMDYIITDRITSPVSLASQYSEKLAYMPDTFFVGDHRQMFPHLMERVIFDDKDSMGKKSDVPDNVSIMNATDLSPIIEKAEVKVTVFLFVLKKWLSLFVIVFQLYTRNLCFQIILSRYHVKEFSLFYIWEDWMWWKKLLISNWIYTYMNVTLGNLHFEYRKFPWVLQYII